MTNLNEARRTALAAQAVGPHPSKPMRRFRLPEETGVLVALVLMMATIGFARPRFLNPINLFTILGNTTFQGMLSLGMVFLLAIREIDLSVGWVFNFSAVFAALLMVAGLNPWLAMLAGIGFGALLGLVNGLLVISLRLPSIIITLGTFSMFEGLSLVSNQGRAINPPNPATSFFTLVSAKILGVVPVVAIVFVALTVALHFVLHRTRFGYRVQAVGSNPDAALLAGIPNALVRLQTLVLMGAIAGLSGSMYVGFRGAIDPQEGSDFVLTVIAAVIIGGTPLSGGSGTVFGAMIGMLIIQVIASGIIFFGIDATWSTFVTGAVIIVAVVLDQIVRRQRMRRAARGGER
jgi:ribose/xylose/arabinose/galactoside ABC-type transport system permease subunit